MSTATSKVQQQLPIDEWNGRRVEAGESASLALKVGESYSGQTVRIPIHVRRALREGPVVFVTAALHGDELNGAGAVRALIQDETLQPKRGALILAPVLNVLGFDRHSRYLPDRRDLNRSFPGSMTGSLASRIARTILSEIAQRSNFGIDLHTASVRKTNFPNVRADLSQPAVKRIATAFGCELVVNGAGPDGSYRREACLAGCPTITIEAGEVWKVEPGIVECFTRGVHNVLIELDMLDGEKMLPPKQLFIEKTKWVRAESGGFLQFHIGPGDVVHEGQPLATSTSLLGREQDVIVAPFDGVVLGMTTLPATSPGEPVCHLARLVDGQKVERITKQFAQHEPHGRVQDDLATNILLTDPEPTEDSVE